jgi:hypothetical protein
MTEGSVEVDEGSIPTATPSDDVNEKDTEPEEGVDDSSEEEEDDSSDEEGQEGADSGAKRTEKGTKLDSNPKSAVHQQLANAKRYISQMERVLGSPELLRKYAEQNGITLTEAKKELQDEKDKADDVIEEFTPEKLKTAEDVANALNSVRTTANKEIKALKDENQQLRDKLTGVSGDQQAQRIYHNMKDEIVTVQSRYPELNPKSPDFDKELEQEIGSLYEELDFDKKTQSFRGRVSLVKLTDRIMKAAGKAGKTASKKAQTDVIVKQRGKVTSGKGGKKTSSESTDPSTTIAQRIAKVTGNA